LRDGYNADTFQINELTQQKLIASMTGNVQLYSRQGANRALPDQYVLEIKNLSAEGLEDINLRVRKGEVLGIAGLEGSGKKLLAYCCFGLMKYKSGLIKKNGAPVVLHSPIQAIRHNIGLVPDDRKEMGLALSKNVTENTIVTRINKNRMTLISNRWANRETSNYVRSLGIKCTSIAQLVEYLSGGNQQKVLVAKWLLAQMDILFLIEPTEGIDVGARADLYGIFRKLSEEGKTLVIATSDIDELLEMSDRIITMGIGRNLNEDRVENADKKRILADILMMDDERTKKEGQHELN
ncbi:MAG: sugar ABC transporter ATP-binding protein, partial [Chloroflexi bacterium]|nr:sugar ABC transporter ATP-binding protein [Chloroflexota bacterium]